MQCFEQQHNLMFAEERFFDKQSPSPGDCFFYSRKDITCIAVGVTVDNCGGCNYR